MKIAIPRERRDGETRVAASPETVKKFIGLGAEIVVESGAGLASAITDKTFEDAGATIAADAASTFADAAIVLKVQRPLTEELPLLEKGTHLVCVLDPFRTAEEMPALAASGTTAFAMDLMPRITRAQSMDVLSSQANLAGYKSVLDACEQYTGCFPMMTTAAGTIHPAKVLVMGAGVAGLQAIATARRLGAIVMATDVRPAAKEQVMSLGAKFVAVEDEEFKQAESAGGYAKEMSAEYQKKQAALIAETISKMDIVITTAQIPGRPAPRLVDAEMVRSMKPGSVLVDLAVETGGNVEGSAVGQVVDQDGVFIVGHRNVPGRMASVASQLYARNLFNFLALFLDKEKGLQIDWEDDVVTGTLVTKEGGIVHERVRDLAGEAAPAESPEPDATPAEEPSAAQEETKGEEAKTEEAKAPAAPAPAEASPAPAPVQAPAPTPEPPAEPEASEGVIVESVAFNEEKTPSASTGTSLSAAAEATAAAVRSSGPSGTSPNDGSLSAAAVATAAAVAGEAAAADESETDSNFQSSEANIAVSSASDKLADDTNEVEPDETAPPPPGPDGDTLRAQSAREQIAHEEGSDGGGAGTTKEPQS